MKKLTAALATLVLTLAIGSTVQAGNRMGGMDGDCGNCNQTGTGAVGAQTSSDQLRKFQADTIDMRQQMMLKRFEIQRENLKAITDNTKVSALQAEIRDIQTKIHDIRVKSGLPETGRRDGECGPMGGKGGCGNKKVGDCNGVPCSGR